MSKEKQTYGPLWQMQEAVKSEKNKAAAFAADVERYQKLCAEALRMADIYQSAVDALIERGFHKEP